MSFNIVVYFCPSLRFPKCFMTAGREGQVLSYFSASQMIACWQRRVIKFKNIMQTLWMTNQLGQIGNMSDLSRRLEDHVKVFADGLNACTASVLLAGKMTPWVPRCYKHYLLTWPLIPVGFITVMKNVHQSMKESEIIENNISISICSHVNLVWYQSD